METTSTGARVNRHGLVTQVKIEESFDEEEYSPSGVTKVMSEGVIRPEPLTEFNNSACGPYDFRATATNAGGTTYGNSLYYPVRCS